MQLLLTTSLLILYSCSEFISDSSPINVPYKVYVANATNNKVFVIDGNKRELVDSVEVATEGSWKMQYVDRLNTLFVESWGTWLSAIDVMEDTLLWKKEFRHGNRFSVSNDGEYILMVSNWSNINSIFLYSYPEFDLLDSINIRCAGVIENPTEPVFYIGALAKNEIYLYNTEVLSIIDTIFISLNNLTYGAPRSLAITQNGKKLYCTTTSNYLVGIDLETQSVVAVHGIQNYTADIAITPDGKRLYFTDPGSIESLSSGNISIYDAVNDIILGWISTEGAAPWDLGPDFIDISPDGEYAWVTPTANGWGSGPVLVVDLENQEVVDNVWVGSHMSDIPSGITTVRLVNNSK